ncbi:aldo/keto reductase [Bacillus horti]|uniref:Aryl-alcohol dehydrogenase-like predicted oxidoreductase n=1 Tax=Caldalkalibacillus horti TaxID=77523 RepID=A0ABT9W3Q8_9BACI|nr:aldo/keto reductase [Bacillus horti]MDQ0167886.1 aryl-alcohol dehydrogenase-like predicted oxidoreductase [Bacillus horti]
MKKNQLGNSDLYVSEIGLGCMSFSQEQEQKAHYMIDFALDQGVNFLDTADLYEFGGNEEMVGKAIKGKRSQVILGTKVGNRWKEDQEGWDWDPSKAYIKEQVKNSLKRLQTDYIDLYQLHGGTLEDPTEETSEAFEELKKEGYIRYYGISSIRPNVIRRFVEQSSIVSVMSQYSILDRRPEEETLPLLSNKQLSLIARGPLAKGLLSNQWLTKLKENGYLDYKQDELRSILELLQERLGGVATFAQVALRYALHDPTVATVIPGASRMEQLEEILATAHVPDLSHEVIREIKSLTKENVYSAHR